MAEEIKMSKEFHGYLFAKLDNIGSESEGPEYFLQQWDDQGNTNDIPIHKKVGLWEVDPELHQYLAWKVTIVGELKEEKIHYEEIKGDEPPPWPPNELELDLTIEGQHYNEAEGALWIDKQPSHNGPPAPLRTLNITLHVEWPYRSIWHGQCPTSQLYDFFLEDPQGKVIWQWSKSMMFMQKITAVNIWGGPPVEFPVTWYYFGDAIEKMGTYAVRSQFIAADQEVSKQFEIKFAD
jgi:hypothetical protein